MTPQTPVTQTAAPLGLAAQEVPQAPQCARSLRVLASQPLGALPSQSAKPAAQEATVHALAAQADVALASEQALSQRPQCEAVTRVLTSQPSAEAPLQSEKPVTHS